MVNKMKLWWIILISICVITSSIVWAQNKSLTSQPDSAAAVLSKLPNGNLMSESEKIRKRILELRQAKNLAELEILAEQVETEWQQKDIMLYAGLMIAVCGALTSTDFDDDRQYLLLRKYRKLALEKADRIQLEQEVELLEFSHGTIEYDLNLIAEKEWAADRKERTKQWCHVWQRLEKEINKDFDPSKRFEPNYNLPADVRIQEQRNDFIQRKLHGIYARLSNSFEKYAIDSYSRSPANTAELRTYLDSCIGSPELRENILSTVRKNVANSQ